MNRPAPQLSWRSRWADRVLAAAPESLEAHLKDGYALLTPLWQMRVPLTRLRGVTRRSGRAATMVIAGPLRWSGYLAKRLFACPCERDVVDHAPIWALPRRLQPWRESADVVVARVDRAWAAWLFGDAYLHVPEWIGVRLVLPVDLAALARKSKSVAEDMRLVRRGAFAADVSQADADFDSFYHRMYVAYTLRRHGEDAYVRGWHRLRRSFRNGGLLWARCNGEPVAGELFERCGDTLALTAIGVADGDEAWRRRGAIAALYVHVIQYAMDCGYAAIDLRGARPSLTDGIVRYKAKWGGELYDKLDVPYSWLVSWSRLNGAVAELLADSPLVFRDGKGLSGLGYVEPASPGTAAAFQAIHRRLWVPGLRRLALVGTRWDARDDPPPAGITLIDAAAVREGGPRALRAALEAC